MIIKYFIFEFKMDENETKQTIKLWKTDKVNISYIKKR